MTIKALYLFFILISTTVFSQTADEIINKHLEASGGVSNWKNLNSIILKGDVILDLNNSYSMIIYHKRPYQKRVVFIIEGQEILNEGYDGKNGWTYNDLSKKNIKVPGYQPDSFDADILDYEKKGFTVELIGKEKIEGKECYVVELTKFKNKIFYYFDISDYTLWAEKNGEETLLYFDYKNFSGLSFATKMIGRPADGGEYVIHFNQIIINPSLENKLFRF